MNSFKECLGSLAVLWVLLQMAKSDREDKIYLLVFREHISKKHHSVLTVTGFPWVSLNLTTMVPAMTSPTAT